MKGFRSFILLSRAYPDASWAHSRRKFFELAKLVKAPIALEAVRRIDELFEIERAINGKRCGEGTAIGCGHPGGLG